MLYNEWFYDHNILHSINDIKKLKILSINMQIFIN